MRTMVAALLFGVAGAGVLMGYLTLSGLWDEYKDSPDSVYISIAAFWLGIAAIAAVGGFLVLRRR